MGDGAGTMNRDTIGAGGEYWGKVETQITKKKKSIEKKDKEIVNIT
jgi:hypothetical protein